MISNTPDSIELQYEQEEILDRNISYVRDHLFRNMNESLDLGAELIEQEVKGLSFLIKPVVKSFYDGLVRKDLEAGTRQSIEDMLLISKKIVQKRIKIDSEAFNQILNQSFPGYLVNDQTGRQCRRNHPNFNRLRKNLRDTFYAQVISIVKLIDNYDDDISNYYELCRSAFKTADECKAVLKLQTDAMRRGQEIIREDLSILNIPIARHLIFRILRKGFDQKVTEFNNVIDVIYERA